MFNCQRIMSDLYLYYTSIDRSAVTVVMSLAYHRVHYNVIYTRTQCRGSGFSARYCQPTFNLSQVTRKAIRLFS